MVVEEKDARGRCLTGQQASYMREGEINPRKIRAGMMMVGGMTAIAIALLIVINDTTARVAPIASAQTTPVSPTPEPTERSKLPETMTAVIPNETIARTAASTSRFEMLSPVRKKGETKEVELACHTLELIAVTCGEGDDTAYRAAAPTLRDYMKDRAHSWAARAAAGRTLRPRPAMIRPPRRLPLLARWRGRPG